MNPTRMLKTEVGQIFISILLGLGLATLFRKVCNDKNCIQFNGPVISEVDGKTYKFDEYCYQYELFPTKCDAKKKTVRVNDSEAKGLSKVSDKDKQETSASSSSSSSSSIFGFWDS